MSILLVLFYSNCGKVGQSSNANHKKASAGALGSGAGTACRSSFFVPRLIAPLAVRKAFRAGNRGGGVKAWNCVTHSPSGRTATFYPARLRRSAPSSWRSRRAPCRPASGGRRRGLSPRPVYGSYCKTGETPPPASAHSG